MKTDNETLHELPAILDIKHIEELTGKTRGVIKRLVAKGSFPKPLYDWCFSKVDVLKFLGLYTDPAQPFTPEQQAQLNRLIVLSTRQGIDEFLKTPRSVE